jgi:hypothetical protein
MSNGCASPSPLAATVRILFLSTNSNRLPSAEKVGEPKPGPIGNAVRFCEFRRAINHDEKLYDSVNVIKIADSGFENSQQLNSHPSCGELALFHANLLAPPSHKGAYHPSCQGGRTDEFGHRTE